MTASGREKQKLGFVEGHGARRRVQDSGKLECECQHLYVLYGFPIRTFGFSAKM
jgi:hypothetical protein